MQSGGQRGPGRFRSGLEAALTWFCTLVWLLGCWRPDGSVVAALTGAQQCDSFCIDTVEVRLKSSSTQQILDSVSVQCGQTVEFSGVEAGSQVVVQAEALRAEETWLSGQSDEVTVAASEPTVVTVKLEPVARPTVASVQPEPLVLRDTEVTLTLQGQGFGNGEGEHLVELDDQTLEVVEWNDSRVVVQVAPDSHGGLLRLANCGVWSNSIQVRAVGAAPGANTVTLVGCDGMRIVSSTLLYGSTDVLLALSCENGGFLQRMDPVQCSPVGSAVPLPASPLALAGSREGPEVYVALGNGPEVYEAPVPMTQPLQDPWVTLDGEGPVVDMGWYAGNTYIARAMDMEKGGLVVLHEGTYEPLGRSSKGVIPVALSSSQGGLFVAARTAEGAGKLIVVKQGSPLTEVSMSECNWPSDVAASPDGRYVVASCSQPPTGIWFFSVTNQVDGFVPLDGPGISVALDSQGDVAFVWSPSSAMIWVVSLKDPGVLAQWELGDDFEQETRLYSYPAADRLYMGGPAFSQVTILAPYDHRNPCLEVF